MRRWISAATASHWRASVTPACTRTTGGPSPSTSAYSSPPVTLTRRSTRAPYLAAEAHARGPAAHGVGAVPAHARAAGAHPHGPGARGWHGPADAVPAPAGGQRRATVLGEGGAERVE